MKFATAWQAVWSLPIVVMLGIIVALRWIATFGNTMEWKV